MNIQGLIVIQSLANKGWLGGEHDCLGSLPLNKINCSNYEKVCWACGEGFFIIRYL